MAAGDVLAFLHAVDAEITGHAAQGEPLDLHLLGRSALILTHHLSLMTKDVDVVDAPASRLFQIAAQQFEKGSSAHLKHGFYLEAVSSGLPPLPIGFQKRCVDVPGTWNVIRPKLLEAHDLIVTKLKRFHAGDREDIQILCDAGGIEINILRERFDLAHTFSDRDDPKVVRALTNLDTVVEYVEGQRRTI